MNTIEVKFITFDLNIFCIEAIKKAAYRFIDKFAINIVINENKVICELTFSNNTKNDIISNQIADFQKEVLDQDLRMIVSLESAAYRNTILALAFSSSKLIPNE